MSISILVKRIWSYENVNLAIKVLIIILSIVLYIVDKDSWIYAAYFTGTHVNNIRAQPTNGRMVAGLNSIKA
jgi:hypothetical protein